MTFPELVTTANELIDDEYSNSQYKEWFQMCQDHELLAYLYLPTEAILTKVGTEFTLPDDFREMIKIISPETLGTYEIFAGKILAPNASTSTLTIRYNRYPADIDNATNFSPDVPKQYHRLYALYGAMMAQINDEEAERYSVVKDAFMRGKAMMVSDMNTQRASESKRTGWGVIR